MLIRNMQMQNEMETSQKKMESKRDFSGPKKTNW